MTPKTHNIVFARSNTSAAIPDGANLLEFVDRLPDVNIPSLCRGGTCGTCKVALTSGDVDLEATKALSRQERARGLILACSSRARSDLVIEV